MSDFSRRQFMVTAAAVGGAAFLNPARALAIGDSIEQYSGFKMGIQSYTLRHFNPEETLDHAQSLGLHWIEFFPGQFGTNTDAEHISNITRLMAARRISHCAYGVIGFNDDEAHNRRIFEFARLAGIPVLTANPEPASFPILHDLVQEYDIKVAIHNHGPGARYETVEDSLDAVENWDKRIGFCPDTGHYMRAGIDPVLAVYRSRERLYAMHLKDHEAVSSDGPPETILGEGAMDLEAMATALRECRFAGPLSLEYELNPENPIDDIRQGLENWAEAAAATA